MTPRKIPAHSLVLFATFVSIPHLHAAEGTNSLWHMISQGGWAMIPLAACSLMLIYLIIHCLRETRAANFGGDSLADRLADLCAAGKTQDALHSTREHDHVLSRVLTNALRKLSSRTAPTVATEAAEAEAAESLELEENAVAQWIHYLSVIANVAPMIGLLGTVSGMIGGFQTMSAGGMGRPELFAGDISEALITTATGLSIGIPAMIAHSYFNNRLNTLMVETNRRVGKVIDSISPSES